MSIGPFRVGDKPLASLAIDLSRPGSINPTAGFAESEVTILDPDGIPLEGFTSLIADNDVVIDWPVGESVLTKPGIYIIQVALVNEDNRETVSPTAFSVLAVNSEPALWASVADVKAVTGLDVSEEVLARAQFQVEILVGVLAAQSYMAGTSHTEDQKVAISYGDTQWLKRGVAYQAAWLSAQPDVYQRNNVTSIGQDGVSVQYADQGLILGPLAKKALNRVSWLGSRAVRSGSGPVSYANYVEYLDDLGNWERM